MNTAGRKKLAENLRSPFAAEEQGLRPIFPGSYCMAEAWMSVGRTWPSAPCFGSPKAKYKFL